MTTSSPLPIIDPMGTKEQLLRLLEDNRERHVSGAAMAKAIGVSRNAV